jgi:hypothetical protein
MRSRTILVAAATAVATLSFWGGTAQADPATFSPHLLALELKDPVAGWAQMTTSQVAAQYGSAINASASGVPLAAAVWTSPDGNTRLVDLIIQDQGFSVSGSASGSCDAIAPGSTVTGPPVAGVSNSATVTCAVDSGHAYVAVVNHGDLNASLQELALHGKAPLTPSQLSEVAKSQYANFVAGTQVAAQPIASTHSSAFKAGRFIAPLLIAVAVAAGAILLIRRRQPATANAYSQTPTSVPPGQSRVQAWGHEGPQSVIPPPPASAWGAAPPPGPRPFPPQAPPPAPQPHPQPFPSQSGPPVPPSRQGPPPQGPPPQPGPPSQQWSPAPPPAQPGWYPPAPASPASQDQSPPSAWPDTPTQQPPAPQQSWSPAPPPPPQDSWGPPPASTYPQTFPDQAPTAPPGAWGPQGVQQPPQSPSADSPQGPQSDPWSGPPPGR